jgi:hypothetical protein
MRNNYKINEQKTPAKLVDDMFLLDINTGELSRRVMLNNRWPVGSKVGFVRKKDGYVQINIMKSKYLAHRVVWCKHYGEWPDGEIDHINGIKTDNSIINLRLADPNIQVQNRGLNKNNASGYRGVFQKDNGRWRAKITKDYVIHSLGTYDTFEQAVSVRKKAEAELHPYSRAC